MSRPFAVVPLIVLWSSPLGAQWAVLPSPGSQPNSAGARLLVSLWPPMNIFPVAALAPAGPSTTYAWMPVPVTCGPGGTPPCTTGWTLGQAVTIQGALSMPLALGYTVRPSVPFPLPLSPWLPAFRPTPFGVLHLDLAPATLASGSTGLLLDGLGVGLTPSAPPATTTPSGSLALPQGSLFLSSDLAIQALVADPAAPAGLTLSAAFSAARHQ